MTGSEFLETKRIRIRPWKIYWSWPDKIRVLNFIEPSIFYEKNCKKKKYIFKMLIHYHNFGEYALKQVNCLQILEGFWIRTLLSGSEVPTKPESSVSDPSQSWIQIRAYLTGSWSDGEKAELDSSFFKPSSWSDQNTRIRIRNSDYRHSSESKPSRFFLSCAVFSNPVRSNSFRSGSEFWKRSDLDPISTLTEI